MHKSIVCGVDGSGDSATALAVAARAGRPSRCAPRAGERRRARGIAVHVARRVRPEPARGAPADVLGAQVEAGERLLEELAEQGNVETRSSASSPASPPSASRTSPTRRTRS